MAAASATEARYLVEVSCRLGFLNDTCRATLAERYAELTARLNALMYSLSREP